MYWKGGLHHSMKGLRCQAEELGQWMLVKTLSRNVPLTEKSLSKCELGVGQAMVWGETGKPPLIERRTTVGFRGRRSLRAQSGCEGVCLGHLRRKTFLLGWEVAPH